MDICTLVKQTLKDCLMKPKPCSKLCITEYCEYLQQYGDNVKGTCVTEPTVGHHTFQAVGSFFSGRVNPCTDYIYFRQEDINERLRKKRAKASSDSGYDTGVTDDDDDINEHADETSTGKQSSLHIYNLHIIYTLSLYKHLIQSVLLRYILSKR